MRPIPPCKDCERRTLTCHGVCQEYKEWREIINQQNELANIEKEKRYHKPRKIEIALRRHLKRSYR